ncbi:hypothetical protein GCM10017771_61060 [Streptomyces capitiformicae]|uniref:Uncharacterized protein n=1 Tax=Streptomyces capitiformicae TaxID=2014920 RepID=A0A918ZB85_9ACTN|nr:hypothetical protein GCM10017771_61060 [Streptomyces capitiformicae]
MPTGTSGQAIDGEKPDEPEQDREGLAARKRVVDAFVQVAIAVTANAVGQVAGDALARLIGL